MSDDDPDYPTPDDDYLKFIRDEGLDLLALFRRIRDRSKRDLIVSLTRVIAEEQSEPN